MSVRQAPPRHRPTCADATRHEGVLRPTRLVTARALTPAALPALFPQPSSVLGRLLRRRGRPPVGQHISTDLLGGGTTAVQLGVAWVAPGLRTLPSMGTS